MNSNIVATDGLGRILDQSDRFLNRELSWLEFNKRVLLEASNPSNPLLERLKFLGISASNLDEFYMVRIAGLKNQITEGFDRPSIDGLSPAAQLDKVRGKAVELSLDQQQCWKGITNELKENNLHILSFSELSEQEVAWVAGYFQNNVFPVLTPLALDLSHPFPFIANRGYSMLLSLRRLLDGQELRAMIPLPTVLSRFIPVGQETSRFILLEDIITHNIDKIFPDFDLIESAWFRILRDTEFELDEESEDLRRSVGTALKRRRHGSIIRLSVNVDLSQDFLEVLMTEFKMSPIDVIRQANLIGLSDISELYSVERPELKFKPFEIRFPERVRELGGDCFAAIRAKDFIVHHPYESFDVVVQFIRQAAKDPNVIAVKQTLYRTSNDSPTVAALIEAAEAGKSVTAMVELKARFDEEANIKWARDLERSGANVVFGFMDKKTHAKISLVVRREGDLLRSYAHFGTGNYHPDTAKVYTDLSFFTCDPVMCKDAAQVFNFMTGYTEPKMLQKLLISPSDLYRELKFLIDKEIEFARNGQPAAIFAKMNSLVDPDVIDDFYRASNAGVRINLVVRGICCLRPGLHGLSENISVKSIVGRFLEHSRILIFGNGYLLPSENAKVFITSADMMPRNLNWRVEVMVPLENPTVQRQVMEQIMEANLMDTKHSWVMEPNGSYKKSEDYENSFSAHDYFMNNPSLSGRGSSLKQDKPRTPKLVHSHEKQVTT